MGAATFAARGFTLKSFLRQVVTGRREYIAAHNGLRGVAALLVVFYHLQFGADYRLNIETTTFFFQRSYLMVDLFFILSGFIISFTAMPDGRRMTRPESLEFLRLRLARIYPLHLFCLLYLAAFFAFVAIYRYSLGHSVDISRWGTPGLLSFLREIFLIHAWGGVHAPIWNIPSWSISAEFLAYLCFPALVAIFLCRWLDIVTGAMAVSFFVYIGLTTGDLDIVSVLSGLRCLSGFVLGMLIFKYRRSSDSISSRMVSLVQIAAVVCITMVLATDCNDVFAIPCFVVLVWSTWNDKGIVARPLASRPLQFLGKISYSVYLNHYALIQILFFFWSRSVEKYSLLEPLWMRVSWIGLVISVVLIVSTCTFRWIERPSRRVMLQITKRLAPDDIGARPRKF